MHLEAQNIDAAGGYGNFILYRMCAEEPRHRDKKKDRCFVQSKARTIAKVYDVSRNLGNEYEAIANVLCGEELGLDRALTKLAKLRLNVSTLPTVVKLHGKMDRLVCANLQPSRSKRAVHSRASFVSKYLHFHNPAVFPILDSLAEAAIKKRFSSRLPKASVGGKWSSVRYERFCRAIMKAQEEGDLAGKSLREMDIILVEEGKALRARRKR